MRYLFRPPATDAAGLLSLPFHLPLEEWDPELLLEVPQRGISRHVVRFTAQGGHVYALKEIPERLARHEYALLGQFEEEAAAATGEAPAPEPALALVGAPARAAGRPAGAVSLAA